MTGKIIGTGAYIPETVWDNNKLAEFVDTSDEWIRERTGIESRHIATDVNTSYMACEAARRAVDNAREQGQLNTPDEIDAIFVCSMSPDIILPSISCEVQKAIGNTTAFCYDMNAACSGFVFAYNTCAAYMNSLQIKTALIIGAEKLSDVVDWTDRSTCILFGDGAGAVIVKADESESGMVMHSDGEKSDALLCMNGGKMSMDGQKVFRFAVKTVPECIRELLEQMNLRNDDVDWFVLHQANRRIVESVAKRLNVSIDKFPMNLHKYGNTSSASIPILLDEMYRKKMITDGQKIIISGFGAGLSWGAAYLKG